MKAMILAAGRGSRMQQLTETLPKPLLKVANKPLIQYHLENLEQAGFKEIVVNISWLADKLEYYFASQYTGKLKVQIQREERALETGGGVFAALETLSHGEAFLVINSDVMTDFDYSKVPKQIDSFAHLFMVANPKQHLEGDFRLADDGRLFLQGDIQQGKSVTFSGISVLSPQLFQNCKLEKFSLADLFREYILAGQVTGAELNSHWFDVGTVERLALAKKWRMAIEGEIVQ